MDAFKAFNGQQGEGVHAGRDGGLSGCPDNYAWRDGEALLSLAHSAAVLNSVVLRPDCVCYWMF